MLRVIRVGGSLLTWDGLPRALDQWMKRLPIGHNVLVAGGGPWVELLRQSSATFKLDDVAWHWLSIRAMSLTARLLAKLVPGAPPVIEDFGELRVAIDGRPSCVVFDVHCFLREIEARLPGSPLPHSWDATSDSISARLAEVLGADELVLLKSASAPPHATDDYPQLASLQYVDPCFPDFARSTPVVRFVNLRCFTP